MPITYLIHLNPSLHFSIVKMFAQNKDDRKRVEKALENTGLPSGKTETVAVSKFTFEEFYNLYKNLTTRNEVEKVFDTMWVMSSVIGHY